MDQSMHAKVRWAVGAFIAIALLLAVLLPGAAEFCSAATNKAADLGSRPITSSAGACIEFWFNRYQTLFGGIAAIGAAWYAGFMVRAQIRRTEKQIDLSRAQIATDSLDNLRGRIREANALVRAYQECIRAINECNRWIERPLTEMSDIADLSNEDKMALYINNLYETRHLLRGVDSQEQSLLKIVRDAEASIDLSIYPIRPRESFAALTVYAVDYVYGGGRLYRFLNIKQAEFPSSVDASLIIEAASERPVRDKKKEVLIEDAITSHRTKMQYIYDQALESSENVIVDRSLL